MSPEPAPPPGPGPSHPFELPIPYQPAPARLSPHAGVVHQHSRAWCREMGLLDVKDRWGERIWDEARFESMGIPLMAAYCHPEAGREELELVSDWYVWAFWFDDHIAQTYKQQGTRSQVEECLARLKRFVQTGDTPPPANPAERGLADLWSRTLPGTSPEWRRRFAASTHELIHGCLQELENMRELRVPNPIEYIGLCRTSGGAPWAAELVEYAGRAELPHQILGTPAVRALRDAFSDGVRLLNDLYSYQRETEEGELGNGVLVLMTYLGCGAQEAADRVNALRTSRLRQFADAVLTELAPVVEECGLDAEERGRLARYVRGLQDWQSGSCEWHRHSSRYPANTSRHGPPAVRSTSSAGPTTPTANRPTPGLGHATTDTSQPPTQPAVGSAGMPAAGPQTGRNDGSAGAPAGGPLTGPLTGAVGGSAGGSVGRPGDGSVGGVVRGKGAELGRSGSGMPSVVASAAGKAADWTPGYPFRLPVFEMPWKVRMNPHRAVAHEVGKAWACEMGMVGVPGGVWSGEKYDAMEFARWCAMANPSAAPESLELMALWFTWVVALDDYFMADYQARGDVVGARRFLDRLAHHMPLEEESDEGVPPLNCVERGLPDLWARTASRLPEERRPAVRREVLLAAAGNLWEMDNRALRRVPDPVDYIEMSRVAKGVGGLGARLVPLIQGLDISEEVLGGRCVRELVNACADHIDLTNDIFSYRLETEAERNPNNGVLAVRRFLGCGLQAAVDIVNDQLTACVRRFERIADEDLPDEPGVAAYAEGLRRWMSGNLAWHIGNSRYLDPGPVGLIPARRGLAGGHLSKAPAPSDQAMQGSPEPRPRPTELTM